MIKFIHFFYICPRFLLLCFDAFVGTVSVCARANSVNSISRKGKNRWNKNTKLQETKMNKYKYTGIMDALTKTTIMTSLSTHIHDISFITTDFICTYMRCLAQTHANEQKAVKDF